MTTQEKDQLISWTLLLKASDTTFINKKAKSLVLWVSPIWVPSRQLNFSLEDYSALLDRVEVQADVEYIAEKVFNQSNQFIQTGVRADKSARPIKS